MSRLWTDNSTDRVWTDNSTDRVWAGDLSTTVAPTTILTTVSPTTIGPITVGPTTSPPVPEKWISDNKGQGPWDFVEQKNKYGYLNNLNWSKMPNAIEFCDELGNRYPLNPDTHDPCGHWHKNIRSVTSIETVIPYTSGRWRAGKEQTETDYIVMFDEHQNNVIRLDVSGTEAKIQHILDVDISWSYAIEVGLKLSPHPEKGGHCITEDGNTAFYLLRLTSNDDCWLVEVDLSGDEMVLVRKTFFSGLYTYNIFDDEVSMDMVASDDFVFLATSKESGRIIKFDRTNHSILIDKEFGYATALAAEGIGTLMINDGQLYWTHVRRPVSDHVLHIVTGSFDLVMISEITESGSGFSSPLHNAFLRLFDGYIYYARQYYPGSAPLRKYNIDLSSIDQSRSLSTMILDVWVDNIYIYYLIGDIDNDPIWLRKRPIDNFSTLLEETDVTAKVHKYDRVTAMNYKKHRLLVGDSTYVTTDHYINHISLYNNSLDFISTEDFPSSGTYTYIEYFDINYSSNEPVIWPMK